MHVHRNILLFTWLNFFTDFKLYIPVAILYFSQVSGSFALGMSIFSIVMLASAVLEVPTGIFSDRIGRRLTVSCGALASVLYTVLYAIGGSYEILVVGAIFEGLSRAFYSGNNDALLHDSLVEIGREDEYAEYAGKLSSYFQIALGLSALVGSLLAAYSFSLALWVSVIPQILCFILSLYLKDVQRVDTQSGNVFDHLKGSVVLFIRNPKLRLLSISSMLSYGIGEATYQFQPAFYQTLWPVWALGIPKMISNIGATVGFLSAGQLLRRLNGFTLLVGLNIYKRVVTIVAVVFPSIVSPILFASTSFPWAVAHVVKDALLQKEYSSQRRATMSSLNVFGGSVCFAILSLVIGLLGDWSTPGHAVLYSQIVSFSVLFLYWKMFKNFAK